MSAVLEALGVVGLWILIGLGWVFFGLCVAIGAAFIGGGLYNGRALKRTGRPYSATIRKEP